MKINITINHDMIREIVSEAISVLTDWDIIDIADHFEDWSVDDIAIAVSTRIIENIEPV